MAYRITITNTDTNAVEYDNTTNMILGAVDEEHSTRGLVMTACTAPCLAGGVDTLKQIVTQITDDHPQLKLMLMLGQALKNREKNNEESIE